MANTKLFLGGIPYALDVKKLEEIWPASELKEGLKIPHEDLEGVLELKRGSQRYYGVVNSWVKKQRDANGINLAWQQGEGLLVLNPAELMSHVRGQFDKGFRGTARAIRRHADVDRSRLDDVGKARYDHEQRLYAKTAQFLGETKREIACDLAPIKCLPKPKLIRQAS